MQPNCCTPSVLTVFQGDQRTLAGGNPLSFKAIYAETGDPLDLTSCTAVEVFLPNADGTFLSLTLASAAVVITSPANLGKFTADLTSVQSAALKTGELQDFDVTFTISGNPFTVRYSSALTVNEA